MESMRSGVPRLARFMTKKEARRFAESVVNRLKGCWLDEYRELTQSERIYRDSSGEAYLSPCRWGVFYTGVNAFSRAANIANTANAVTNIEIKDVTRTPSVRPTKISWLISEVKRLKKSAAKPGFVRKFVRSITLRAGRGLKRIQSVG